MDHGIVPFDVAFVGDDADPTRVVQGDLDAASAPALVDAAAAHRPLQRLTVDTSKLSFVDSAGLRALLAVREMVRRPDA